MIDQEKIREILVQAGLDITSSAEDFDKPFKDIGLDSLDVFSFLSEVEVVTGKSFSDDEFVELKTLSDVMAMVNANL